MDEHRYKRAKELFMKVCDLDPVEQLDMLEKECAGDVDLRLEVESLLVQHVETTGPLRTSPAMKNSDQGTSVPQRIGPYRVLSEIDQGGMGVVYLGVREDDKFKQRVAIKVLRRDRDSAEILQRFELERQLLAAMNHPGIARLFDGGKTEDGLPYFVMEYVEGQPIDQYCDRHRLRIGERLELFERVCSAVHYAHQNLVVHRDLKPGNIIVTKEGMPKLLDFGIAKLLNPELSFIAGDPTAPEFRVMTPRYASPEQMRGDPITTASDVYSLGVLLYELMTGHRPYRLRSRVRAEIERVICEEDPEKPSTAISRVEEDQGDTRDTSKSITPESVSKVRESRPDRLRRQLAGDVDNIVLMALRKEPQRRYTSALQFAEDIKRHRNGLPVIARADTFGYRFWKFVQRHRAAVAAGVVIALLLVGGIIATSTYARIAAHQRSAADTAKTRAITERERSDRLSDEGRTLARVFMDDFHDSIVQLPGSIPARELLVKHALAYIEGLQKDVGDDASLKLDVAHGHRRIALILGGTRSPNLGRTDEAIEHIQTALEIHSEIAKGEPRHRENLHGLTACHLYLGDMLRDRGQPTQGDAHYVQAFELSEQLLALFPKDDEILLLHSTTQLEVGDSRKENGDYAGALELYQKSLNIREDLVDRHPKDANILRSLSVAHTRLGALHEKQERFNEALRYFQMALDEREVLADTDHTSARAARDVMNAHLLVGSVLAKQENHDGTLLQIQAAFVLAQRLARDPLDQRARKDLPRVRDLYGRALANTGHLSDGRQQLDLALGEYESLASNFPDDPDWPRNAATIRRMLTILDSIDAENPPD